MPVEDPPILKPAAEAIHRSRGSTMSERLLADLGEQAFLNLWSYPNLFYDKKKNGKGDGKELCDMLVVCGEDVIIFSDKHIKYQTDKHVQIAWPRFYRKAIEESVVQINGANNWMTRYPEKIYTDPSCTQRLPVELPPLSKRRVHGVVVARGAHDAIREHMKDDSGSFMIDPSLKGHDSIDFSRESFIPFTLGDVNPGGMFIHVFDDVAVRRVLEHLDTISDFTHYLNKRADYLRSDKLLLAHGEEELLARYLHIGITTGGNYDFERPRKKSAKPFKLMTAQGEWSAYLMSEAYFARTLADQTSKIWDRLINVFTENILAGTGVSVLGSRATVATSEPGVRFMAMENRFARRMLGESVAGALKTAMKLKQDRYTRVIFPSQASADPKLAYVIVVLAYPTEVEAKGGLPRGYEQYRETRAKILEAYCYVLLSENPNLHTAVGIAMDAHSSQTGRRGGSEDMFAMRINTWTDEMRARAAEAKKYYGILQKDRLIKHHASHDEFPVLKEKTDDRQKWPKHKKSRLRFKKKDK
jgi:hypothetical protein